MSNDDVLSALTPVRPSREPPALAAVSTPETRLRVRRNRANRQSETAVVARQERAKHPRRPRRASTRPLTTPEITGMLSQLIREAHKRVSSDSELREADRKHAAITMAVLTDKWTVVTGRPTAVIRVEEGEKARPAVLRLAEAIARGRGA